jgi:hypothetical protein
MRYIKLYEDFKVNSISVEDIIECIKKSGRLYSDIVIDLPDTKDKPLLPISVDDDGLVTIDYEGSEYEIEIKNVKKIEY